MPKRVGYLYDKFSDREFVLGVLIEACRHRGTKRRDVEYVKAHLPQCAERLASMLESGTFKPSTVRTHRLYDTSSQKWRDIKTVPFFPDACVQWLIVEVMKQPVFYRGMDANSSASIPDRGCMHVYRKIKRQIGKHHRQSKYALQCDIRHYYPSVNLKLLMEKLRRRCKDERLLSLIWSIVSSASADGEHGLAIGFYLDQWLANFYLEDIDRTVRSVIEHTDLYVRYMDNLTVLSGNKRRLWKVKKTLDSALNLQGMRLKDDWQIFPTSSRAVKAVGYKFYPDGTIQLRKRNWLKFRRQMIRVRAKQENDIRVPITMARGLLSRIGSMKHIAERFVAVTYVNFIAVKPLKRMVKENT